VKIITLTDELYDLLVQMASHKLEMARQNWKPAIPQAEEFYRAVINYEESENS
jgi:hypothetical protein